jgi:hypothetical protein
MFHFYIPEEICFAAFVAFVARGYTMQCNKGNKSSEAEADVSLLYS